MKKWLIGISLVLLLALGIGAAELPETDYGCATMLYDLHMLAGKGIAADGSVDFDLYGSLTRAESIVQVIRFLGVESAVKSGIFSHPFTDVPAWADKYVGYAYQNGITGGRSATKFAPDDTVDAAQFMTLLLRAVGYSDKNGDFSWDAPFLLAASIGMTDKASAPLQFARCDAFRTCARALYASQKNGTPVYVSLVKAGVFTMAELEKATAAAKSATDPQTEGYYVLSKAEYLDKTTAGFLSQITGFLSGYEFTRQNGKLLVGMPDDWYKFMAGPYAVYNVRNPHETKLLYNAETRMWETWLDDDFSIDILNQYILRDMRNGFGTVTSKVITDGWVDYNVYDMGGGNRDVGAYALMKYKRLLPAFSGAAEFGNHYNYCTEPWIGNETLGMNAAGMPNAAVSLAETFGRVTGDRENVEWTKYIAAMYAMAYFEDDIETLIRAAAKVFPEGAYEHEVIEACFVAYKKYPNDWRAAARLLEASLARRHDRMSDTAMQLEMNVNNAFVILGLLYGGGDYDTTCRILSLAGYDGDCTAAVGMSVVGILGGMECLPEKANERLWQNGKGMLVNLPIPDTKSGYWMCMLGLPERMALSALMELYRENFEWLLVQNGGYIEGDHYFIPKADLRSPDVIWHADFENATTEGMAVKNAVLDGTDLYEGGYSVRVDNGGEAVKTLTGLTVGAQYRAVTYVRTAEGAVCELFARGAGKEVFVTVEDHADTYVRRTMLFTATAETMELGVRTPVGAYSRFDQVTVTRVEEQTAGTVTIMGTPENGLYSGVIMLTASGTVGREVLLKLEYANPHGEIVYAATMVNGKRFNSAPLSKTGATVRAEQGDYVYIPVVLREGENTVTLNVGAKGIAIRAASLVTLTDTY